MGFPVVLPHRLGFHQIRAGSRYSGRPRTRIRRRFARLVRATHHRSRSDQVRPASSNAFLSIPTGSPCRISDTDFCVERRDEVIKYVTEKYGTDHVAQIVTFGTMAARAAVRDAGRALAVPPRRRRSRREAHVPRVRAGCRSRRRCKQIPELRMRRTKARRKPRQLLDTGSIHRRPRAPRLDPRRGRRYLERAARRYYAAHQARRR